MYFVEICDTNLTEKKPYKYTFVYTKCKLDLNNAGLLKQIYMQNV